MLDAWYPKPALGQKPQGEFPSERADLLPLVGKDDRRNTHSDIGVVEIDLNSAPASTPDAYLRLHLLSHLLVKPNTINLEGIFGHLPLVAFTNAGPVHPADFDRLRLPLQRKGITAHSIDKFPRLLDYLTPQGVRIADASRVRLGAYLSPGTTIMHEGFVNFNAGTLGTSMIEGRISQGVLVGDGSDVGGGASIMGTLSGGGTERITIGKRVLLGANSGVGVSLGDDCIVEAGLYLTAGSKITLLAGDSTVKERVKASSLSGASGLLFRRNSLSGAIEALPRSGANVSLNQELHA